MKRMLYLANIGAFSLLMSSSLFAQTNVVVGPWTQINESSIPVSGTRYIKPTQFLTFSLDVEEMRTTLASARRLTDPNYTPVFIHLPRPDGTIGTYKVYENETMSEGLAALFPEIRSFDGIAKDGTGEVVKFDLTPQGFHAMTLTPGKQTTFIDPYSFGGGDITNYIVYSREYLAGSKTFECHFDHEEAATDLAEEMGQVKFGDCTKRNYRLALSATGEYVTFQGGTVALAQAAQVTTMNRVNGVYMRDLAVNMTIIANNNLLIYTNASTDPYTNGDPNSMIDENQTNVTSVIGSANYDIGHVFGTDSGGLAGLGVVCVSSQKASGVTGSSAPVGDAFDIDYVAHEMGHEFHGNHSFRGNGGACAGNANGSTAMEPGSGSSIMAYAGICTGMDVQPHSDDYFHGVNLAEMHTFLMGTGNGCAVSSVIPAQSSPTITGSTTSALTIPANTPFALTATATDPDGDIITYCWEQMNNQSSTQPPVATATGGPNFRTFNPTLSGTRYFPSIAAQLAGGPYTWEKLPSVSRTMNFRCVVRDNEANGGCNDSQDITISTTSTAGPFIVNYPSTTGISWAATSTQTVTWSVANTDIAPVSCANVDILLSTDGGVTFVNVADNTPNDGSQDIVVPNTPSTTAIIMVICENGTFFDISNNVFAITTGTPCSNPTPATLGGTTTICQGETTTLSVTAGILNDATDWQWYTGSCGGTNVGTGTSITVSAPGTYYVRGEGGCVTPGTCSTITVTQTTVNPAATIIANSSMNAQPASATYQWVDCNNGMAAISGATAQNFVPTVNGSYAVIVTKNGCTDTSACVAYNFVGLEENALMNVSVFPNPTNGNITVQFASSQAATVNVTDVTGRVIRLIDNCESGTTVDLAREAKGVYFLNIAIGNQVRTIKVTKQ